MSASTDIANRALTKVGAKRISDLTEDSREGCAVNSCFSALLRAELQTNLWVFALRRVQLAADTETPVFGRSFQFSLPNDFVRLAPVEPFQAGFPRDFYVENRKILTNEGGPLDFRYVSDDIDTALVDPLFAEALASRIAMEISEELTQSNAKHELLRDNYANFVRLARTQNSITGGPIVPEMDEWVLVRLRGTLSSQYRPFDY